MEGGIQKRHVKLGGDVESVSKKEDDGEVVQFVWGKGVVIDCERDWENFVIGRKLGNHQIEKNAKFEIKSIGKDCILVGAGALWFG